MPGSPKTQLREVSSTPGAASRSYADLRISQGHHLTGAYLGSLTQLHLPVDRYQSLRHQRLARAAAVAHTGELEQLVQLDELAAQVEFELLHESLLFV